jgi:hypothetical protein
MLHENLRLRQTQLQQYRCTPQVQLGREQLVDLLLLRAAAAAAGC